MLKESGRERINAVYGTKEQCRKEFQDEISRLRNQFQLVRGEFFFFSFSAAPIRFDPIRFDFDACPCVLLRLRIR